MKREKEAMKKKLKRKEYETKNQYLFLIERAGTAYRHLFQVMKNKNYYFQQCYTILKFYLS